MAERLIDDIFTALDEQTVVVAGHRRRSPPSCPAWPPSYAPYLTQRAGPWNGRSPTLLEAHPLSQLLTSMPGIGVRTGTRILIDVGDASTFPTAGHLASYAGLAPASRISGSSIRGEQPSRRGNRQLKRALFLVRVRLPRRPRLPHLLRPQTRPAAKPTPKPSSASPDAASTSCSPCSATAPSTNHGPRRASSSPHNPSNPEPTQTRQGCLDEGHRGTPPARR